MNKVIGLLKRLPIRQILTVFLAGILVLVSTACGGGTKALAKTSDQIREEVPESAVTSEYKGGMNDYSDVDPRSDTSAAAAKAKALEENAERNLENRTGNPLEAIKRVGEDAPDSPSEVGENIKKAAEDIGDTAARNATELGEKAKAGSENLKENTENFLKEAKDTVQDTTENAAEAVKSKVSSDIETTKEAAENAAEAVKSKVSSDIETTKEAAENAGDAVKSKVSSDIETTKRALKKPVLSWSRN